MSEDRSCNGTIPTVDEPPATVYSFPSRVKWSLLCTHFIQVLENIYSATFYILANFTLIDVIGCAVIAFHGFQYSINF